jgi:hypothetical protein
MLGSRVNSLFRYKSTKEQVPIRQRQRPSFSITGGTWMCPRALWARLKHAITEGET